MSPLVEASWEATAPVPSSSGSMALASCLPSSTLSHACHGIPERQRQSNPHWSNELMFQIHPCTNILCSYMAVVMISRRRKLIINHQTNERAKRVRGHLVQHDRVCGPVPGKHLVWHKRRLLLISEAAGRQLRQDLVTSLSRAIEPAQDRLRCFSAPCPS